MAEQHPGNAEDAAHSLTMAVIAASPSPLLLLDGELRVVAASVSFCEAFGIELNTALNCAVFALGAGEWDVPSFRKLLGETASGVAQIAPCEMALEPSGHPARCLIIQTTLLVYDDFERPRILIAIADVTDARSDARAKDDAVEHIEILLQEVRHRVANSLQIVAAVLLQNARRSTSPETRVHLKDAHHRVMSIAALERQLSETPNGNADVELGTYFTSLCHSIAASLIDDAHRIALVVTGGGLVSSRVSASLGLIVTELVINALKHAFPGERSGSIEIVYEARSPNWTLSVCDDGVGMSRDRSDSRTGLGTSIVQALANQLHATVEVVPAKPGTTVSIKHAQVALVGEREGSTPVAGPIETWLAGHEREVSKWSSSDG